MGRILRSVTVESDIFVGAPATNNVLEPKEKKFGGESIIQFGLEGFHMEVVATSGTPFTSSI